MGSTGCVPREPGLGIDRAFGLGGDVVEHADPGVGHEDASAEAFRTQPVVVDVHEDLAGALTALECAHLHYLAGGADRDITVRAAVRAQYRLRGREPPDLP